MQSLSDSDETMKEFEKNQIRRWIKAWEDAAPALEKERRERILQADTGAFIRMTSGLLAAYLKEGRCRTGSGLVEQQRLFRLLAHE
jgi:hypothetical protein